jgi:hypothetical protein
MRHMTTRKASKRTTDREIHSQKGMTGSGAGQGRSMELFVGDTMRGRG